MNSSMNNLRHIFLIPVFSILISSCEEKKDAVKIAQEQNSAKFYNNKDKSNSNFTVNSAETLLQEMQLGKLAQNNSIKDDVRETGKIIENEYRQSYFFLKQIAEKKKISIPSEVSNEDKKINAMLSYEIADDFDKMYFDLAEKNHRKAIGLLKTMQIESEDKEIKIWTEYTLPKFRKNLDNIIYLKYKTKVTNAGH
jgi:putative membrane protein